MLMQRKKQLFTDNLNVSDPELFSVIEKENNRQEQEIELIASENITSLAVMQAQGSVMTNKYAEGYPGRRYYGGCEYVDMAEELARETNIDFRIFELYILIAQLKEITLNRFKCAENVQSFLSNKEIECEGIVVSHVNHWSRIVIKLVQRYTFSNANFNNPKFAVV